LLKFVLTQQSNTSVFKKKAPSGAFSVYNNSYF